MILAAGVLQSFFLLPFFLLLFSLLGAIKDDNGVAMGPTESQHPVAVAVDEGEPKDRELATRRQGRARVRRHDRR